AINQYISAFPYLCTTFYLLIIR
ncbi:hypothetical protein A5874_002555, partial [Enterococcus faecium]